MNQTNLIPASRLARRAKARRLRRWIAFTAMYLGLLITVSIAAYAAYNSQGIDSATLSRIRSDISRSTVKLASLRRNINSQQAARNLLERISDQPDWALLLLAVADKRQDDIFFSTCELNQTAAGPGKDPPVILHIEGVGPSQESIAGFVVRLGTIPVLQNVKLLQTNHKVSADADQYSFHLSCVVGPRSGGHHD